jgi:hypothetical protein
MVDTPGSRQPVKLWQPKPLDPKPAQATHVRFVVEGFGIWYEDGSLAEPSDSLDPKPLDDRRSEFLARAATVALGNQLTHR